MESDEFPSPVRSGSGEKTRIELVTHPDRFSELEGKWAALLERCERSCVFLTHAWYRSWWASFGQGKQLCVPLAWRGEDLVGAGALCIDPAHFRGLPVRRLGFLANGYSTEADFLLADASPHVLAELLAHLVQEVDLWDWMELTRVPSDSPTLRYLQNSPALLHRLRSDLCVPYIPVQGEWDALLAQRSRNFRRTIHRRHNLLERSGREVSVVRLRTPDEILRALPHVRRISGRSWKAQHAKSLQDHPQAAEFLERLVGEMGSQGGVELWMLLFDRQPVAFEYHLTYGGVTCPIRADFDEAHRDLSPGAHLEHEILRTLHQSPPQGVVEYNTCADGYAYERRWTNCLRRYHRAWAFRRSPYGRLLYALGAIRRQDDGDVPEPVQTCRPNRPAPPHLAPPNPVAALPRQARRAAAIVKELASDAGPALQRECGYYQGRRTVSILALTWRCTSHCMSCTAWRRKVDPRDELSVGEWLDVGRALLDRGVQSFELFGGDVFLRKDVVFPLCELLHAGGGEIHIPTNCNLVDRPTAELLARTVHTLYLSVDGVEGGHDQVRGTPGTFGRMLQALEWIREARGERRTPRLVCNTTVSRHNMRSLPRIGRFAVEAGFDEVHFEYVGEFTNEHVARSCIDGEPPSPLYLRCGESCLIPPADVPPFRRRLRRVREDIHRRSDNRVRAVTANIDALSDGQIARGTVPCRRCFVERTTVVIDPCGALVPCVFFDHFPVGNVREGALRRSWETPQRKNFRDLRAAGELELCHHCIMSVTRNRSGLDMLRRAWIVGHQRTAP